MASDHLRKIRSLNATKYDDGKAHDQCLKNGYELLEKYSGYQKKYNFRCIKHNKIYNTWFFDISTGRHGLRCCSNEKMIHTHGLDIEYAKNKCLELGFELICEKWLGCRSKYNFKCIKHNKISRTTWTIVTKNKSLKCCGKERCINYARNRTGFKNPNYNPNLTEKDRLNNRSTSSWKKKVKEKYKYTCHICSKKDLIGRDCIAHHIQSYRSNKNLRLDLLNGICLCSSCHIRFHKQYGFGNNTKKQFNKFEANNG